MRSSLLILLRQATALLLVYALPVATCPIDASAIASPQEQSAPESVKLPNEQLDSLVAPIALYPDPLLAQVLVASTYPLEVIQLQQFLDKNKGLKDKALTDAVMKQDWDPAVQSLAALPDMVKILSENVKWTTDLGNAFLAQQNDVMNAVQRMRAKAQGKGQLKSTEQQKVETKVIENKQVIVIEQSKPDVVYVPSYDPVVVYGAPAVPYYPMTYPPGYAVAGMAVSFGVGMMMGAAWGGGWCCNSGWGSNNNININNNNNFVNNSNRQNVNAGNRQNVGSGNRGQGGSSQWQHNPQHRGGTPYGDRKTASQFGGTARGDSMSNRQASARQQQGRMQQSGMRDSGRGAGPSTMDRGGRGGASSGGFGGDRAGSRDVSRGSGSGAFGGASSMSGRSAGASQSRGASSMRSGGGGGGGRSGGGRRR